MERPELNCVYCSIYEQIAYNLEPFNVSSGQRVISINLGITYCVCGGSNACEYHTGLLGEYYHGTPVCRLITTPGEPWGDPLSFDLSKVSF